MPDPATQRDHWAFAQLTQGATELSAMILALTGPLAATRGTAPANG
jgi:hypothetical protein